MSASERLVRIDKKVGGRESKVCCRCGYGNGAKLTLLYTCPEMPGWHSKTESYCFPSQTCLHTDCADDSACSKGTWPRCAAHVGSSERWCRLEKFSVCLQTIRFRVMTARNPIRCANWHPLLARVQWLSNPPVVNHQLVVVRFPIGSSRELQHLPLVV